MSTDGALTLLDIIHTAVQAQLQGCAPETVTIALAKELRGIGCEAPLIESIQRTVNQVVITVRVCGARLGQTAPPD